MNMRSGSDWGWLLSTLLSASVVGCSDAHGRPVEQPGAAAPARDAGSRSEIDVSTLSGPEVCKKLTATYGALQKYQGDGEIEREVVYEDGTHDVTTAAFTTDYDRRRGKLNIEVVEHARPRWSARVVGGESGVDAILRIEGKEHREHLADVGSLSSAVPMMPNILVDVTKLLVGHVDERSLCNRMDWASAEVSSDYLKNVGKAVSLVVKLPNDGSVKIWVDSDQWVLLRVVERSKTPMEQAQRHEALLRAEFPQFERIWRRLLQPSVSNTTVTFRLASVDAPSR